MVDSVYRTRSLGVGASGLPDQYADGKAARVWQLYIGSVSSRTDTYRQWICKTLRDHGCHHILDVACGTGIDSIMLLEEGFQVTSSDASDKMLKYALKERWNRRKEDAFDKWVIEEGNWLTLKEDLEDVAPAEGFDAVLCLGNSFAHLPDFDGDQHNIRTALKNFAGMVKPGGVLMVDHRNYDYIIENGRVPQANSLYYKGKRVKEIKTSVLWVDGTCKMITLDYTIDISEYSEDDAPIKKLRIEGEESEPHYSQQAKEDQAIRNLQDRFSKFRLSYHPHRLETFNKQLTEAFDGNCKHTVYGDFKPIDQVKDPGYYIHVVQKL
ncbi:glycine N-methyltransferase-like isoform X1 [Branchiostoma floridae]|uniref:Glycine N-methyltransferase n=1 Tax=Branchiostoma floridae TaxID=7739 RepID=A0A9J7LM03_BRAFL|nr:glycine N-methyltransferase-like isoform X1 [Branchiostoma floridae]